MSDTLLWHRIQFAFTITYHYLFPQSTMGLALLTEGILRDENEIAEIQPIESLPSVAVPAAPTSMPASAPAVV